MKTAILSDIHSNLEALERVCERAAALGAQRYICLGDFIGYGADPGPTLARIMTLPGLIAVRGNHDTALFRDPGLEVPADIRQASDWTRAQLLPAQLEFLAGLPLLHREARATYVHASAHEPEQWDYLRMPDQIHACLAAAGTPIVFIGHVHMPCVFYETTAGTVRELCRRAASRSRCRRARAMSSTSARSASRATATMPPASCSTMKTPPR